MNQQQTRFKKSLPSEALVALQRELAVALTTPGPLTQTLSRILKTACRIKGIDCGGVYVVSSSTRTAELACHYNLSSRFLSQVGRFKPDAREARLLRKGRILYLDCADLQKPSRDYIRDEGLKAVAVVPVRHNGETVASLNLASRHCRSIPRESRAVIESFAAQIGPVIARVRAEAALEESRMNFHSFFDAMEDFLFVVDLQGRILHANPSVERRLGYTRAELQGSPVVMLHPSPQRKRVKANVEAVLEKKINVFGAPLIAKNGTKIPVEVKIVQGEWNGRPALFGVCRDVTDRKRSEKMLLARERQLRALVSELAVAEENERRRIAQGLHDDISQILVTAKFMLEHVAAVSAKDSDRTMMAEVGAHLDHVLQMSRSLTFDLASPVLQRLGFEKAVEDLCGKMSQPKGLRFTCCNDGLAKPLRPEAEIVAFHTVRELLRNVAKHAHAANAHVSLVRRGKSVVIQVEDDGVGMHHGKKSRFGPNGGFGLYTIRERVAHWGGVFSLKNISPHGLRVKVILPLAPVARTTRPGS